MFGILLVLFGTTLTPASAQSHASDSLRIVDRYSGVSRRIIDAVMSDSAAYNTLAYLCDTFGPRLSGSRNLEIAIDWTVKELNRERFDYVHTQPVKVPRWVRGRESLELMSPRQCALQVLGLGGSIGTPSRGITARALVVGSFEELQRVADEARGKIVVYNVPFTTYGQSVRYRSRGAIEAARAGAVASLISSVTPYSQQTPHTGSMSYADSIPRIPHAAISPEDAQMLQRMQDRGQQPRLKLKMGARTHADALSHNIVAELRGHELPHETVVIGGHFDSWDVGQGAHDDAGGCVASWHAIRILKNLGLRPRRTIRLVFWTNEENGVKGSYAYADAVKDSIREHVLAIEADAGVFQPTGFGLSGSDTLRTLMRPIMSLLSPIGADSLFNGGGGVDIGPLMRLGVPGMGLNVDGTRYFWYHHSHADTVDKVDPADLNRCAAALAVMAYIVADLPIPIPR